MEALGCGRAGQQGLDHRTHVFYLLHHLSLPGMGISTDRKEKNRKDSQGCRQGLDTGRKTLVMEQHCWAKWSGEKQRLGARGWRGEVEERDSPDEEIDFEKRIQIGQAKGLGQIIRAREQDKPQM